MKTLQIVIAIATLALAGCTSTGNELIRSETAETINRKITKGQTRKEEVSANLGSPSAISFTDLGNEIWTYKHKASTPKASSFIPGVNYFAGGNNVKLKTLVILFDKQGIVQNYTFSDSKHEKRWGFGAM